MQGSPSVTARWAPVPWAPHYRVSDAGDVANPYGHVLKPRSNNGHPCVRLFRADDQPVAYHQVAHLVLEAFVGPAPAGRPRALHEDADIRNCALRNLRWASHGETCAHHRST